MTTYAETCGAPRGTMGFRDASGRARYKAIGAPDSESFATIKEAEAAARKRNLAQAEAKGAKATGGGTKPAAAPYRPPSYSKADVDKAAATARGAERQRIRTVFASEAVKGREQLAAHLLAAPEGYAASDIIAKLPAVAASLAAKGHARTDAVWARANAAHVARINAATTKATGRAPKASAAPAPTAGTGADAVWDRANAKIEAQRQSNPLLSAHAKARGVA